MILAPPAPAKTHSAGPPTWDPVVNALRDELEEYGGLVRLYDEQQKQIFAHDAEAVTDLVPLLEQQAEAARLRRLERERAVRAFAATRGRTSGSSLREMLPEFPHDVRPLLQALIDEINELARRIRKRGHQNQMLLGRLVELHRELLPALGRSVVRTYSNRGQVALNTSGPTAVYRATG